MLNPGALPDTMLSGIYDKQDNMSDDMSGDMSCAYFYTPLLVFYS